MPPSRATRARPGEPSRHATPATRPSDEEADAAPNTPSDVSPGHPRTLTGLALSLAEPELNFLSSESASLLPGDEGLPYISRSSRVSALIAACDLSDSLADKSAFRLANAITTTLRDECCDRVKSTLRELGALSTPSKPLTYGKYLKEYITFTNVVCVVSRDV